MTPLLILTALLLLWTAAAVFWVLDTPSPRQTAELLLDGGRMFEEPVAA